MRNRLLVSLALACICTTTGSAQASQPQPSPFAPVFRAWQAAGTQIFVAFPEFATFSCTVTRVTDETARLTCSNNNRTHTGPTVTISFAAVVAILGPTTADEGSYSRMVLMSSSGTVS